MRYVQTWVALDSGLSQKPWFAPPAATTVITYSFHTQHNLPAPFELYYGSDRTKVLTGQQKDLVRDAMDRFEAAGNLVFVETAREAAINILAVEGSNWGGWSSYPTQRGTLVLESMSMGTILHEIGHSLGFKHPFEAEVRLRPDLDTKDMTIMSYTGLSDALGPLDRMAARNFYGRPDRTEDWEITSEGRCVVISGGRDGDLILGARTRNDLDGRGGDDRLIGQTERDRLYGGAGDDRLNGMGGHDELSGGQGDDTLLGMSGNDQLDGGAGNDWLKGMEGRDELWGGRGDDTLLGMSDNDRLHGGPGNDRLEGMEGRDELSGGTGDDTLLGRSDNDRLHGGADNDWLMGMEGHDELLGGKGDDMLVGASGNDRLHGGPGEDLFVFRRGEGTDRITDFKPGTDRIEIRGGGSVIEDLAMRQRDEDVVIRIGDDFYSKTRIIVEDTMLEQIWQDGTFSF